MSAFALVTLIVGLGRVYSPQYLLWIIGLAAAAGALAPKAARPALIVLGVTVVLAHIEFPFWFWDALFYDRGGALIVLITRDVLTLVVGALALRSCFSLGVTPSGDDGSHGRRHGAGAADRL
jgi:hypothetical protein